MEQAFTTMRDLIRAFAAAMNFIEPEVEGHHEQVTYLAARLAEELEFSGPERNLTFYGALLHDVGSVMMRSGRSLRELEALPGALAKASAALLRKTPVTAFLSEIVEESQSPWRKLKELPGAVTRPRFIGQVIHLADMVSLLLKPEERVLNQLGYIRGVIGQVGESEFHPKVLEALDRLMGRESVWMDMQYAPGSFLAFLPEEKNVTLPETVRLAEFVSAIIDFRSPFTAMHSAGVSATAEFLARLAGMSRAECGMMKIAGLLHDVGKLKVPREILEKPGKLTDEEFNIMKEHAYYTYAALKDIRGFEQITPWAAYHHEKLSGKGYPFHLDDRDIPLGARIMAVSDVFSAITEDRPYRKGMTEAEAMAVLREDAGRGALSPALTELLLLHFEEINAARAAASDAAGRRYRESMAEKGAALP